MFTILQPPVDRNINVILITSNRDKVVTHDQNREKIWYYNFQNNIGIVTKPACVSAWAYQGWDHEWESTNENPYHYKKIMLAITVVKYLWIKLRFKFFLHEKPEWSSRLVKLAQVV